VGLQEDIFDRLILKVNRAKDHIIELHDAIEVFLASDPYKIVAEDNTQTGERTFYVHYVKKIPPEFSTIIGDALQNLRSALDHLAYHLVSVGPGGRCGGKRAKHIYFPIFESAAQYEAEKMGKIEGMGDAAIKAIDAVEPYKRGNGWALWDMHSMNNRDKHSLLIPTWGNLVGFTFPKSKRIAVEKSLHSRFPDGLPRGMLCMPSNPTFVEDGGKLLTIPISEVEDHMDFRIAIAFGDPEIVRGKEVVSTLEGMRSIVFGIITEFSLKGLL